MILIDYSQVAISNIAVQLAMSKDKNILSIPMVRHMILNYFQSDESTIKMAKQP